MIRKPHILLILILMPAISFAEEADLSLQAVDIVSSARIDMLSSDREYGFALNRKGSLAIDDFIVTVTTEKKNPWSFSAKIYNSFLVRDGMMILYLYREGMSGGILELRSLEDGRRISSVNVVPFPNISHSIYANRSNLSFKDGSIVLKGKETAGAFERKYLLVEGSLREVEGGQ